MIHHVVGCVTAIGAASVWGLASAGAHVQRSVFEVVGEGGAVAGCGATLHWEMNEAGIYQPAFAELKLSGFKPIRLSTKAAVKLVVCLGLGKEEGVRYVPGLQRPSRPDIACENHFFVHRLDQLSAMVTGGAQIKGDPYHFEDSAGHFVVVVRINGRSEAIGSSPVFCQSVDMCERGGSVNEASTLNAEVFDSTWGDVENKCSVVAIGLEGVVLYRPADAEPGAFEVRHVFLEPTPIVFSKHCVQVPEEWSQRLGAHMPLIEAERLVGLSVMSPSVWRKSLAVDPEVFWKVWVASSGRVGP